VVTDARVAADTWVLGVLRAPVFVYVSIAGGVDLVDYLS